MDDYDCSAQVADVGVGWVEPQRVLFAPAELHYSHRLALADTCEDAERCGLADEPPSAPRSMTDLSCTPSSHS